MHQFQPVSPVRAGLHKEPKHNFNIYYRGKAPGLSSLNGIAISNREPGLTSAEKPGAHCRVTPSGDFKTWSLRMRYCDTKTTACSFRHPRAQWQNQSHFQLYAVFAEMAAASACLQKGWMCLRLLCAALPGGNKQEQAPDLWAPWLARADRGRCEAIGGGGSLAVFRAGLDGALSTAAGGRCSSPWWRGGAG